MFLWEAGLFSLFRPPTDWTRPTYVQEDNLLYTQSNDFIVHLVLKNIFRVMSRFMFDPLSGYCGLVKLKQKMNSFRKSFEYWSNMLVIKGLYHPLMQLRVFFNGVKFESLDVFTLTDPITR